MKIFIFLLLSVLLTNFGYSQKKQETDIEKFISRATEQELLVMSSTLLTQEDYVDAELVNDKLLSFKPESPNYNYRKGYVVIMLREDYEAAIPFLTKAIVDVSKNFDLFSIKELRSSVDAFYYLGKSYHFLEQIDEAKEMYKQFIAKSDKKSFLLKYAHLGLQQCEVAEKLLNSPNSGVVIKNAGSRVNSQYPEYSPVVSLDGTALYYTIRKPWENNLSEQHIDKKTGLYLDDIYVCFLDEEMKWKEPIRLEFCKPDRNEATVAINVEERVIYSYSDLTGGGDIYYSDFKNNEFDDPQKYLAKNVNTEYWESHLTMSPNGDLMYFVSNRPGGYGGRDIYESKKLPNGTWSEPVNMGPNINTAFDEDSPFISADEEYFYFASNGSKSMGGFDIMYATKNENGTWGESVNIGYPLNTCGDDLYYTSTADGYFGYFTSNRPGGKGEKDIYEVENNYMGVEDISFLKVKINTVQNQQIPDDYRVVLTCLDCPDKNKSIVYTRLRDGMLLTSLETCKTYKLSYQIGEDFYVIYEETIQTECDLKYQEIIREQLIDVIEKKKIEIEKVEEVPVIANKVIEAVFYFKYNKNKLVVGNREFKKFMKEIVTQLEEHDGNVVVKVSSSASKVPTTKYENNEELSRLRAENIKYDIINYIGKMGDFSTRINVVIVESVVSGPEYENDKKNKEKYEPYQFSKLKTEN